MLVKGLIFIQFMLRAKIWGNIKKKNYKNIITQKTHTFSIVIIGIIIKI